MITCREHSEMGRPAPTGVRRPVRWAILFLIAASALAASTCSQACVQSRAAGPAFARSLTAGAEKASPVLLAKMIEKDDQIIYRTDSEGQKSSRELEREEKEKQERSWQMLERTEIYNYPQQRPHPPRPPDQPRQ